MIAHFSPFVKTANLRIRGLFCLPWFLYGMHKIERLKLYTVAWRFFFTFVIKYDIRRNFAQNVNIHIEWDNIATLQNAQNML